MLELAEYLIRLAGNAFEARYCMASRMDWHLPVQEETD